MEYTDNLKKHFLDELNKWATEETFDLWSLIFKESLELEIDHCKNCRKNPKNKTPKAIPDRMSTPEEEIPDRIQKWAFSEV